MYKVVEMLCDRAVSFITDGDGLLSSSVIKSILDRLQQRGRRSRGWRGSGQTPTHISQHLCHPHSPSALIITCFIHGRDRQAWVNYATAVSTVAIIMVGIIIVII